MADRGLGLARHEVDAVGVGNGRRRTVHQAGDAAHLDDVGLDHANAGIDQVLEALSV